MRRDAVAARERKTGVVGDLRRGEHTEERKEGGDCVLCCVLGMCTARWLSIGQFNGESFRGALSRRVGFRAQRASHLHDVPGRRCSKRHTKAHKGPRQTGTHCKLRFSQRQVVTEHIRPTRLLGV